MLVVIRQSSNIYYVVSNNVLFVENGVCDLHKQYVVTLVEESVVGAAVGLQGVKCWIG